VEMYIHYPDFVHRLKLSENLSRTVGNLLQYLCSSTAVS
jgi:hypothetical protein